MALPHELTVVIGTPNSRAKSAILPNLPMMSDALIPASPTIFGGLMQGPITNWVVESSYDLRHPATMFDTDELLARLEQKGVRNIDIARALGLPDSRVPEIKQAVRAVDAGEASAVARELLEAPSAADVRARLAEAP